MTAEKVSRMTLRALEGCPLDDHSLRDMVVATAHGIAERNGIDLVDVSTTPSSLTVAVKASRIEAMGLLTELRRLTTNWYTNKFDCETLWGEPRDLDDDSAEAWKRA